MGGGPGRIGTALGTALFVALALLAIGGFAITRAARSGDDLVNSVELSPVLIRGIPAHDEARVSFTLANADDSVDVLIIDGDPGSDDEQVRALTLGEDLGAGEHVYHWDGLRDDREPAAPGLYALRVVLGEEGRDILPPGRIEVIDADDVHDGSPDGDAPGDEAITAAAGAARLSGRAG
ncbi:MAG: hypothetical protein KDB58_12515 [Solirubrobacterales bacterium]|nr:hypothetical protein [Solirubrobacterales bacterium]MCB8971652.1 hypothetical protein [Thermoleophilales bacterium]MCO5326695.1 hypothetical protein [Solirubrobacterales bacterium]